MVRKIIISKYNQFLKIHHPYIAAPQRSQSYKDDADREIPNEQKTQYKLSIINYQLSIIHHPYMTATSGEQQYKDDADRAIPNEQKTQYKLSIINYQL
jgi:hypothetical protein